MLAFGQYEGEPGTHSPLGLRVFDQSGTLIPICFTTAFGESPENYPLQKKRHSDEFLRKIAHLRVRTNKYGAMARIRSKLSFSIHEYFQKRNFHYVTTPIITGSDCEGAGEMFKVTSLDLDNIKNNKVDFNKDFFSKEVNLTVSGQLNAELGALALSEVYTFGPTFRAENSNTSRHLAEFWMVEPEMAFYDIIDNMNLAEDILKYIISYVIKNCFDDLEFLQNREIDDEKNLPQIQRNEKPLIERLKKILNTVFERITYTEAFNILRNSKPNKKGKFKYKVDEWGIDFQSEHERFLVEKHFKKPVIVIDYPKNIKAFYMKRDPENDKVVLGMDVLAPEGYGEIIGGGQRTASYDLLIERLDEHGLEKKVFDWYLDLRKFGSVPHAGFGMGIERVVAWICHLDHVRETIPFPAGHYPDLWR